MCVVVKQILILRMSNQKSTYHQHLTYVEIFENVDSFPPPPPRLTVI